MDTVGKPGIAQEPFLASAPGMKAQGSLGQQSPDSFHSHDFHPGLLSRPFFDLPFHAGSGPGGWGPQEGLREGHPLGVLCPVGNRRSPSPTLQDLVPGPSAPSTGQRLCPSLLPDPPSSRLVGRGASAQLTQRFSPGE